MDRSTWRAVPPLCWEIWMRKRSGLGCFGAKAKGPSGIGLTCSSLMVIPSVLRATPS